MIKTGEQLQNLCLNVQSEILFVAPFIKASTFKKILTSIKPEISIKCVTRWFPEEILTGVSDLDVWLIIESYPNASLWLRNDLHAKYYRVDDQCLIGSANLTANALGWSHKPNLELMVQLPLNFTLLQEFESNLWKNTIQVNSQLYYQYVELCSELKAQNYDSSLFSIPATKFTSYENWIPTLRNPEELYLAYTEQWDRLTNVGRELAVNDLKALFLIPNLNRINFNAYVGILLLEKPIIQKIDEWVKTPQRFGAVRDLLVSLPCADTPNFNAERAWQTLMRWLLYFLPTRYALSVPNHSEIFYRINS